MQARRKKTRTKLEPGPIGASSTLEEDLNMVEGEARAALAEHGDAEKAAVTVSLEADEQEMFLASGIGLPLTCPRCKAARRLLEVVARVRFHLRNQSPERAARQAIKVGEQRVVLEVEAYRAQQAAIAQHDRGPYKDERKRRNKQILTWNSEFLMHPSGKPRKQSERVRMIHEKCQQEKRTRCAEAHYSRNKKAEAAAAVWNIGIESIKKVISTKEGN